MTIISTIIAGLMIERQNMHNRTGSGLQCCAWSIRRGGACLIRRRAGRSGSRRALRSAGARRGARGCRCRSGEAGEMHARFADGTHAPTVEEPRVDTLLVISYRGRGSRRSHRLSHSVTCHFSFHRGSRRGQQFKSDKWQATTNKVA